ncbi:MAG: TVP38/TMEM64 family protein [Tissierellia bacterium]|nr:TVP38/TMEM64 family protein [Tissierellia bacterium]
MKENKYLSRILNYITLFITVLIVIFCIRGYRRGIFNSPQTIKNFIANFGMLAPFAFIIFQIIQVVFPIIPGGLSLLAGVLMFGPLWGFLYNYIGICLGSISAFLIARRYGKGLILSLFGREKYKKYSSKLQDKKYNVFFALAIFFPVAPDDLLCYLTGLSNMSLREFSVIIILGKPMSIALYSFGLHFGFDFIMKWVK